jgi:hypothetical protein
MIAGIVEIGRGDPRGSKCVEKEGKSRGTERERARPHHENTDTSRKQNDDYIEGPKMSEEPAAAPALPIDIILPRLELFCSSGNVSKLL